MLRTLENIKSCGLKACTYKAISKQTKNIYLNLSTPKVMRIPCWVPCFSPGAQWQRLQSSIFVLLEALLPTFLNKKLRTTVKVEKIFVFSDWAARYATLKLPRIDKRVTSINLAVLQKICWGWWKIILGELKGKEALHKHWQLIFFFPLLCPFSVYPLGQR